MRSTHLLVASLLAATLPLAANAHEGDGGTVTYATDHAPIGVMGDHRHKQGEWMVSYRYMFMDMEGNRDGTDSLSPEEIATSVPNRFAGTPGQPPTLRVVPTQMDMEMHMVGGMYGVSDRLTVMAMTHFIANEMDHVTFMGGMGSMELGEFTTEVSGLGDSSIGIIYGLDDGSQEHRQVNVGLSLSLPTGSLDNTDTVLTPMGMQPELRLPYPMQLSSGTFDLKPSLTGFTRRGDWSFGGQASATIRLDENDEGYTLGDVVEATAWAAYEFEPSWSVSGRLKARSQGAIDGIDPAIVAPVQTADPDNHGGETLEALVGINFAGNRGFLKGNRFAVEAGLPLYRDLNGPQLETDLTLTLGWQRAF